VLRIVRRHPEQKGEQKSSKEDSTIRTEIARFPRQLEQELAHRNIRIVQALSGSQITAPLLKEVTKLLVCFSGFS
jgi:hypothetical protein